jgi:hypothetical protein
MLFKFIFFFIHYKKLVLFFLFSIGFSFASFSQSFEINDSLPYNTILRVNINGGKIGIEKRVYKNYTGALSIGYYGGKLITINPQIRYYTPFFKNAFSYIGIGYLYKHNEYNNNDTVKIVGTNPRYTKDFQISKYIHAFTLNAGWFWQEYIFKKAIIFEFNIGAGVRFKKSNRYGLADNEALSMQEAFVIRPQHYEDTKGLFKLYPEINACFSILIPLKK